MKIHFNRINELTKTDYKKSFNFFNKNNFNLNITYKKNALQKIRDGIRNGTIIKEYQPDGTYIWRNIRK